MLITDAIVLILCLAHLGMIILTLVSVGLLFVRSLAVEESDEEENEEEDEEEEEEEGVASEPEKLEEPPAVLPKENIVVPEPRLATQNTISETSLMEAKLQDLTAEEIRKEVFGEEVDITSSIRNRKAEIETNGYVDVLSM